MSMATRSSDLDNQKFVVNVQTKGQPSHHQVAKMALKKQRHLGTPPSLWQRSKHQTALRLGIVWKFKLCWPKMVKWHHPPHAWQAPMEEDMLWDGISGLMEAVVTGPGQAILLYGRWYLGEGLSLGKAWETMFILSGDTSWIGKQAQLKANPVCLGEGWWLMTQIITEQCIEPRRPRHPHSIPPASEPFIFHNQGESLKGCLGITIGHCTMIKAEHYSAARNTAIGNEIYGPPYPITITNHGFESDWSSVSTSSSVSSRSDSSGGCRHSHHGQYCRGLGGHMKINLPVFKDEDTKDAITYQSWCWDLIVYCHAGCWDYPLCYPFPTRLPRRVGKKSGDRHPLRWCTFLTGWTLQQHQSPRCFKPGAL